MKEKVAGYLIRIKEGKPQLLVFDHVDFPEAGRQVPGGGKEALETQEEAVLREFREEAGLTDIVIAERLGVYEFCNRLKREWQRKTVFVLTCERQLPDEWLHRVHATGEDDGMLFRYYWVSPDEADLIYDQGDYLKHICLERLGIAV